MNQSSVGRLRAAVIRSTQVILARFAFGVLLGGDARGQAVTPLPASVATPTQEAAVVLSPFEVNSGDDKGYAASSTLAGTRTNEKLANLPNTILVFTSDLLSDLAITDFFGAVDFAAGAENIYNDTGTVGAPVGTKSGNQISFRGIASVRRLRDGFPWFLPADT